MCGRMNVTDSPHVRALLAGLGVEIGPIPERNNIAPTENVLAVYSVDGELKADWLRWWLVPSWSDGPSNKFAMFNARVETVATSRAYRGPFKAQRCVVLATSFIEWQRQQGAKQPYQIEASEDALLLAGVWDDWRGEIQSCSIITQPARDSFADLHHRMPLALTLSEAKIWLSDTESPETMLEALRGACVPLQAVPVASTINNSRDKARPTPVGDGFQI